MNFFTLIAPLFFSVVAQASADRIYIPGTEVSFEAPAGFTPLTKEELVIKFPTTNAPAFVVGNERRTTTVAYDIKPLPIADKDLEEGVEAFGQLMEGVIPGLTWKDRKVIEMAGQRWIYLEMTSTAIDADIHNIMLMTPFDGKTLLFNFNSTKEDFPKLEEQLRMSIQSIKLKKISN